jgi:branched-chain amino acid transport system permease protein
MTVSSVSAPLGATLDAHSPRYADRRKVVGATIVIAAVIALLLLPFLLGTSELGKMQQVMYMAVAVMSVTLLTGRLGQFSLGQGAYVGVGAYVTILLTNEGVSWYLCILLAAAAAGLVGAIAGLPALRIQGLGLVLVSLGIAIVFPQVILRFDDVTGGAAGLLAETLLPGPEGLNKTAWSYWVLLAMSIVLFALASMLVKSRTGRALVAIRDQEIASRTLGINVKLTKVSMYAAVAAIAGVAGWMFAAANRFVAPADFATSLSINLVLGMIIGGKAGSVILGPIIGAVFLVYMRDAVPQIGFSPVLTPFIYGIILILFLYFLPLGASDAIRRLWRRISRKRRTAQPSLGQA